MSDASDIAAFARLVAAAEGPGPFSDRLDLGTTRVVVICLARFEGEADGDTSFTLDDRLDGALVDGFRAGGVPDDRVLFLQDAEATRANIEAKLPAFLARGDKEETLVFYYGSHGGYDADAGAWSVSTFDDAIAVPYFFDTIEASFPGARALVFGDTCYSGAFVEEARRRDGNRVSYAALSSAFAHNTARSAWRFVDLLVRAFRGDPSLDGRDDGDIDFEELARFTERYLGFSVDARPMFATTGVMSSSLRLAKATGPRSHPLVGALVEVEWKGDFFRAEILAVEEGTLRVHYIGYGHDSDESVAPTRVRVPTFTRLLPGAEVEVKSSSGDWYPGKVRASFRGLHLASYDGWSTAHDEWFGPSRVRPR